MRTEMQLVAATLILALRTAVVSAAGEGSCAAARKCCDGRDPDCAAGRGDEDYYDDYTRRKVKCPLK